RVAAIRLEAVERGAAVRRERLADDAVPDVVVRMIERLASGRLPGSAGGEQQQGQAAGERAAERGHRVLLELGPDASGANYGTGGRRGPGPLPRRPCTQTVGAERKQVRPPLRPCGHPTGEPEARSRSISRTATSPASPGRAPHTVSRRRSSSCAGNAAAALTRSAISPGDAASSARPARASPCGSS